MKYIAGKISKVVGVLNRLKNYLPAYILKVIYLTFIVSYFTYGIEAWLATYKDYENELFILQKKTIVAINSLQYRDHTDDYFKSMDILQLRSV